MKFNFIKKLIRKFKKQKNALPKIHYDIDILLIDGLNSKYALKPDVDLELVISDIRHVFKKLDIIILNLEEGEWFGYYAPSTKQPILIYQKSGIIQNIQFSYSRI